MHRSLSIATKMAAWMVFPLIVAAASPAFAAPKQYQVTGKVLAVTEKMVTVEKADEKWEIERTADTKVDGQLKVGEKVTIHYHMVADKVDSK
jgi:hypothetical protein